MEKPVNYKEGETHHMLILMEKDQTVRLMQGESDTPFMQIPVAVFPEIRFHSETEGRDFRDQTMDFLKAHLVMKEYKNIGVIDGKTVYKEI